MNNTHSFKRPYNFKWTQEEDQLLRTLHSHYGDDFQRIAKEMNLTFGYTRMTMGHCKKRWRYSQNPHIDRSPLSLEEVRRIYPLYMESLRNGHETFWRRIVIAFAKRTKTILRQRLVRCLVDAIKKLVFMYGPLEQQWFYYYRLSHLSGLTLNVILYFTFYEASHHQLQDEIFRQIYCAGKVLADWIKIHFELDLADVNDISFYFNRRMLKIFPRYSEQEVENVIEPILLLDTLNRVCYNFQPYEIHDGGDEEVKRKLQFKEKRILKARERKQARMQSSISIEELFYPLSREEIQLIQNSRTLELLLPIQSMMQRRSL